MKPATSIPEPPTPESPGRSNLRSLQELLYCLITAPTGVGEGLRNAASLPAGGLESLIRVDQRLSAVERVEIYADMYFHRLLGVLKEDYPATLAVMDADNFHNLITGYLIEHPPTEPSIFHAGNHLADFLAAHPQCARWPFAAELARLERTLLEVFHAPEASPLDAAAMRTIPPTDWPSFVMRTHPAAMLLDCQWRVAGVLRAVESGASWRAPAHEPVSILVWRNDSQAHYRELDAAERAALGLASGGAALAAICEAASAAFAPGADASSLIHAMIARWLADGALIPDSE
ncbi:MAG: HvfC/BufC family peptide modification chaperone [Candidatus Binataceae bacterium]